MNQSDRDFDAEMGPTYICTNCGKKFKFKTKDLTLCIGCTCEYEDEIHSRLKTKMNLTNNY